MTPPARATSISDGAFIKSSNPYFIEHGWKRGRMPQIVDMGDRFHLGKRTGVSSRDKSWRDAFPPTRLSWIRCQAKRPSYALAKAP